MTTPGSITRLPVALRSLFWDVDPSRISWSTQRDFMIRRLLQSGGRQAARWLLAQVPQQELGRWLLARRGGGMSPRRLRYWQLMLDLPSAEVDRWIAKARAESWGRRIRG